ncbi:MAG: PHP domain-containing protein [Lachnospiraceae bacterium]|nr:PHP domain-containing protein [Lachnospiraceae bacterium]
MSLQNDLTSSTQGKTIDLHTHSTASDGSFTPTDLAYEAKKAGVSAIALTDHDSVNGIDEITAAGEKCGMEIVPGVELSTEYLDEEIHVVGLFIDHRNETLKNQLQKFVDSRDGRNLKIIERLHDEGFDISAEEIYARNPDSVVARPHIARYLVETGQVPDVQTVFDRYIGAGRPCYVERYKITPIEAVALIHEAEGLAILAHPCLYKISRETLLILIREMKEKGLDGIEALYSCNEGSDDEDYCRIAREFDLLISGGSDFHGASKPDIHIGTGKGNLHVPYELLDTMKEYLTKKNQSK